jgi:RimJ/RimL family protein N-acetyltransferase
MYIIEGEKIGLRSLELEDVKVLHKEMNNANMTQYLLSYRPFSLGDEEAFVKSSWEDRQKGIGHTFGVIEKKAKKLIGTVSLMRMSPINKNAELGVWIAEDYWNKGYGPEAEKLMVKYGFNELNLHSIYASAYSFNERSIKAMKKIGMKEVGRFRERIYRHGKYHDAVYLDILKKEFKG